MKKISYSSFFTSLKNSKRLFNKSFGVIKSYLLRIKHSIQRTINKLLLHIFNLTDGINKSTIVCSEIELIQFCGSQSKE